MTEPTECAIAIAHKGFVWSEITVEGRAAHGSRPHLGEDAIVKAAPILAGVGELDRALGAVEHPLLGRGSVHASTIEGGAELSSYPASCVVTVERRTLPGETGADVEAEVAALLDGTGATSRTLLVREPFEVDGDEEVVRLLRAAVPDAEVGGVSYWADSAFIAAAGIPTVLFGPGGEGAHAAVEWVSLSDTEKVTAGLVELARRFCG